jgi:transcriptional regulator with XRE-family HTH domain
MVTEYGKYLRKLRIDRSETISDMARKLGISAAYLSLIENGGREIPSDFSYRIWKEYNLNNGETECLREAEYKTPVKTITIDMERLDGKGPEYGETARIFRDCIDRLSPEQVEQIKTMLCTFAAESGIEGVIGDFS